MLACASFLDKEGEAIMGNLRAVPAETTEKMKIWRFWSSVWNWLYIAIGVCSAGIASLVAANAKAHFWGAPWDWILATIAAALTFLITTLRAQAKAAGFELAARELEKEIAVYKTDVSITDAELGKAEARGIDILNKS
jgi:hypothetical protein